MMDYSPMIMHALRRWVFASFISWADPIEISETMHVTRTHSRLYHLSHFGGTKGSVIRPYAYSRWGYHGPDR
jgi:hypothetical protein